MNFIKSTDISYIHEYTEKLTKKMFNNSIKYNLTSANIELFSKFIINVYFYNS